MSEPFDKPWKGRNGILLSIDIGITHSGVSFIHLENGAKQTLHRVTKWPGQEGNIAESMIPTMVWYNTNNEAVACGAEALSHPIEEQAKNEGWFLAKNFKAHLYPEDSTVHQYSRISALPFSVSLRQVYSDFLRYLLKHTKSYFEERILDGARIWETYQPTMEVLMSHPNGWGVRELSFLRDALLSAGYTTSDLAARNIRFMIDSDASACCCLSYASLPRELQTGDIFILCDAGTATTNISLHKVESTKPVLRLATCDVERLAAGAISVDVMAEKYMRQKMTSTGIPAEVADEFTRDGVKDFRNNVKFAFNDETKDYLVQIANTRYDNPTLGTRRGRMVLPGPVVKLFFKEYIDTIKQAIDQCVAEADANISHILLVGGFGNSSYLQRVIKESYEPEGYQIALTANSTSRAVVDGALIQDTGMNNGCRPRRSVGIETSCGTWLELTTKGNMIHVGTEVKKPVSLMFGTPHPKFDNFELTFLSYTHETETTRTRDTKGVRLEGFSRWFTLSASLDPLSQALVQRLGANNEVHWRLNFDICVRFGEAGLEAYLVWEEKGEIRNSPVTIRPDYEF